MRPFTPRCVVQGPTSAKAFTLIELLMVIAIIGALAGLLLSAFHRARQSALGIICRNNLRQLGIASAHYASDSDRFPSMLDWLYDRHPDVSRDDSGQPDLSSGLLFPYLSSKATYLCPSERPNPSNGMTYPGNGMIQHGRDETFTKDHSYVMNCRMCHARNPTVCLTPSTTMLFMERTNLAKSISGGLVIGDHLWSQNRRMVPALPFIHNQRGNMLMIDGHTESMNLQKYQRVWATREFWYPTAEGDLFNAP